MEIENKNKIVYHPELQNNLLPSSLKVLSKLNLVNKNVIIKEDIPTIEFVINYKKIDTIQFESTLIQLLINKLNKDLETKNNLYITTVVNSISIIEETDTPPYLLLTSRCYVD